MVTPVRVLALALVLGCGHRGLLAHLEPEIGSYVAQPDADVRAQVLRASVAEARGDLEEAERAWRWAVRLGPRDPWTWHGLGGFLERSGRADEALQAYEEALARQGDLPEPHLGIGRILVGRGDDLAAAPHLEAAAAGRLPEALHLLARLRLRAGDDAGAAQVYAAWSARPATVRGEWLDRGRIAIAVGRPAAAVDDLVAALEDGEGGPPAAEILARLSRSTCRVGPAWRWAVEERLGEREDPAWRAVAVVIGLSARDPDLVEAALGPGEGLNADLVADRVDVLVGAGRFDAALALLDDALLAGPDESGLAVRRARVLVVAGRSDEALAVLAEQHDERYAAAARRLAARVHLDQGDPEAALEILQGQDAWADVRLLAEALSQAGRPEEAERALLGADVAEPERWRQVARLRSDPAAREEALLRAGDDPRALRDLAVLQEVRGRVDAARETWTALAARDPSDTVAWRGLARVTGDPAWLRRAVEVDPCEVEARLELAATRPPCERAPVLEAARDAAPRDAAVLGALASAYHACGLARQREGGVPTKALEGLRDVEWTWRVIGDDGAADAVRALRVPLEVR